MSQPPSLQAQAILLERMLSNGLVEAYRKHRKLRPAVDETLSESLWASVQALREAHERKEERRQEISDMSLLDVLASLPQFRSLRLAQDFIDELNGRGWLISLSRMPCDTEWLPSAPRSAHERKERSDDA